MEVYSKFMMINRGLNKEGDLTCMGWNEIIQTDRHGLMCLKG